MFAELGKIRPPTPQPSIHDNVGEEPLPDVEQVLAYLRASYQLISAISADRDVFDPSRTVMGGDSIMTDGDWMWRYDLPYYVSRHHVTLPAEFLALIRERGYVVPDVDEADLLKSTDDAVHLVAYGKQFGE
ncbi:hypothetical protein [Actinoplanes sp. NPDC051494]|uniref:hypothetical protein n=1 Tax=Actinoplanes sp. NPDC051494 TaxID=3363907 RepID=UPI00379D6D3A